MRSCRSEKINSERDNPAGVLDMANALVIEVYVRLLG
jgi:hypothetical protein